MYTALHVHDGLGSLLDATNRPEDLAKYASEIGMKALAITNHGTMMSVIKHYEACKNNNIKPIIGCEVYITEDLNIKEKGTSYNHLILLAKNNIGYKNLLKLSQGKPYIAKLIVDQSIANNWKGLFEFKGNIHQEINTTLQKVKYKIDNEVVTHTRKAYEENLSIYGKERVIFIKEVE